MVENLDCFLIGERVWQQEEDLTYLHFFLFFFVVIFSMLVRWELKWRNGVVAVKINLDEQSKHVRCIKPYNKLKRHVLHSNRSCWGVANLRFESMVSSPFYASEDINLNEVLELDKINLSYLPFFCVISFNFYYINLSQRSENTNLRV